MPRSLSESNGVQDMKAFVIIVAAMILGSSAWAAGGHHFDGAKGAKMPCFALAGKQLQAINEYNAGQNSAGELVEAMAGSGQDGETPLAISMERFNWRIWGNKILFQ